jgi:hypothetical protein
MPQSGGFPTIPTIPVGGSVLIAHKATTFKDYTCMRVEATGVTKTFNYIPDYSIGGTVTFTVGTAVGDTIEFFIKPAQLTAANDVMFYCQACSNCDMKMTGVTDFRDTGYGVLNTGNTAGYTSGYDNVGGYNSNTAFPTTIIGGGGLNN